MWKYERLGRGQYIVEIKKNEVVDRYGVSDSFLLCFLDMAYRKVITKEYQKIPYGLKFHINNDSIGGMYL